MRRPSSCAAAAAACALWLVVLEGAPQTAVEGQSLAYVTAGVAGAAQANYRLESMLRTGDLRVARTAADPMLPWRTHQHLYQYYKGLRVFGGDMTRELDNGVPVSVFGQTYTGIDIDVTPVIGAYDAKLIVERLSGQRLGASRMPKLVVCAREDGTYALAWDTQVFTGNALTRYFIDAKTGEVARTYNNLRTQEASVGTGTGVWGDARKLSVTYFSPSTYFALDILRPSADSTSYRALPLIYTFDMRGDNSRLMDAMNGDTSLEMSDVASDLDNVWTDPAVVDAHTNAGYVSDYYYKRMGRQGLDDANVSFALFVHPIDRSRAGTLLDTYEDFYVNAFWDGYEMILGEGLPDDMTVDGASYTYFSAGLDVVGHELTHGVTQYTSELVYENESGALDEAFADIMGTSIEFFMQPRAADVVNNTEHLKADYLMGEDISSVPFRSLANPQAYGDPDHYSQRLVGPVDDDHDWGYVHANSTIASHAFYLAIEGGRNGTSGLSVQGVGAENREQIEKSFYRAWAFKLTAMATFSMARAATIQAAEEVYGTSSPAAAAIRQAWDAVGVDAGSSSSSSWTSPTRAIPRAMPTSSRSRAVPGGIGGMSESSPRAVPVQAVPRAVPDAGSPARTAPRGASGRAGAPGKAVNRK